VNKVREEVQTNLFEGAENEYMRVSLPGAVAIITRKQLAGKEQLKKITLFVAVVGEGTNVLDNHTERRLLRYLKQTRDGYLKGSVILLFTTERPCTNVVLGNNDGCTWFNPEFARVNEVGKLYAYYNGPVALPNDFLDDNANWPDYQTAFFNNNYLSGYDNKRAYEIFHAYTLCANSRRNPSVAELYLQGLSYEDLKTTVQTGDNRSQIRTNLNVLTKPNPTWNVDVRTTACWDTMSAANNNYLNATQKDIDMMIRASAAYYNRRFKTDRFELIMIR